MPRAPPTPTRASPPASRSSCGWRCRAPARRCSSIRLRGEVKFENAQIDDQVLLKTDGFPTYHLANVVDDHLMEITHVIRAEEWISSTPKHVLLYQAFGWQAPEWVHMPLLRNADKSKISKRKNPVSLDYYRDAGFLPEALLNYLGTMGWSIAGDREKFTLAEMVAAFSFDRVSLGGPVFDLVKLSAMNADYLRALDDAEIVRRLRDWRLSDDRLRALVPLVRERIQRLDEFIPLTEFFFSGDLDYAPVAKDLLPKERTPKQVADLLALFSEGLDTQRDFSAPGLEAFARAFAEKNGWSSQGAVHAAAPGGDRAQGDAAAVRDAGVPGPRADAPAPEALRPSTSRRCPRPPPPAPAAGLPPPGSPTPDGGLADGEARRPRSCAPE